MKRFALALFSSPLLLALIATPAVATDQQKFDKLIRKHTITLDDAFKPKTLCLCAGSGQMGYLLRTSTPGGALVGCVVPTFDADGKFTGPAQGPTCSSYVTVK